MVYRFLILFLLTFSAYANQKKDYIECPLETYIVRYESAYSEQQMQWCQKSEKDKMGNFIKHGPEVTIVDNVIIKTVEYENGKIVDKKKGENKIVEFADFVSGQVNRVACVKGSKNTEVVCLQYDQLPNPHFLFRQQGGVYTVDFPEEVDQIQIEGYYDICIINYNKQLKVCYLPSVKRLKDRLKKEDLPINRMGMYEYEEEWEKGKKFKRYMLKNYLESIVPHQNDANFGVSFLKSKKPIKINSQYTFELINGKAKIWERRQVNYFYKLKMTLSPQNPTHSFDAINVMGTEIFCPQINQFFECHRIDKKGNLNFYKTYGPLKYRRAYIAWNYLLWIKEDFSLGFEKIKDSPFDQFEQLLRSLGETKKIKGISLHRNNVCWISLENQLYCAYDVSVGNPRSPISRSVRSSTFVAIEDKEEKEFLAGSVNNFNSGVCFRYKKKNKMTCLKFNEKLKKGERRVLPFHLLF